MSTRPKARTATRPETCSGRACCSDELARTDAVVIDPHVPRRGARLRIVQSDAPVLAYVSCNRSPCAAMPPVLIGAGYTLIGASVDQFRLSSHVELAAQSLRGSTTQAQDNAQLRWATKMAGNVWRWVEGRARQQFSSSGHLCSKRRLPGHGNRAFVME